MNIKKGIFLLCFIYSSTHLNAKMDPKMVEKTEEKQKINSPLPPVSDDPLSKKITNKKSLSKTRTVSISNAITDEMTCYKKLNQKYKPDSFAIRVNGKVLSQGKRTPVSVTNDKVEVEYDFSFANGWYKGTRKKSFKLDPDTDSTKLTFEWNDEHRVSLAGAKVDTLSQKN